jgi:hypothetical protein
MKRVALPAVFLVLLLSAVVHAQEPPAGEPEAPAEEPVPEAAPMPPPPAAPGQVAVEAEGETCARGECGREDMCRRGRRCGPDRPRRFAIGIAKGHLELDGAGEGSQKSLLGRVGLRWGFAIELELSRADLDQGGEVKSGGLALEKFFRPGRRLQPYLALGGGGGVIDRPDGSESHQRYGEFGAGLMLRKRRFAIALDLRAGARRSEAAIAATGEPGLAARIIAPPEDPEWERHRYHRARLMAFFQF